MAKFHTSTDGHDSRLPFSCGGHTGHTTPAPFPLPLCRHTSPTWLWSSGNTARNIQQKDVFTSHENAKLGPCCGKTANPAQIKAGCVGSKPQIPEAVVCVQKENLVRHTTKDIVGKCWKIKSKPDIHGNQTEAQSHGLPVAQTSTLGGRHPQQSAIHFVAGPPTTTSTTTSHNRTHGTHGNGGNAVRRVPQFSQFSSGLLVELQVTFLVTFREFRDQQSLLV